MLKGCPGAAGGREGKGNGGALTDVHEGIGGEDNRRSNQGQPQEAVRGDMMQQHTDGSAIQCLLRNKAKVSPGVITTQGFIGLKQLSAIDCLVHHHNFLWVRETGHKRREDTE